MSVEQVIGTTLQLHMSFDEALQRVVDALKTEGFGVLTEIDVQATFKQKLGADFRPYRILGACNPPLSHRALTASSEVGLLLPCNVTVSEVEAGIVEVAIVDPLIMVQVLPNPVLEDVAQEAAARLHRVASALQE